MHPRYGLGYVTACQTQMTTIQKPFHFGLNAEYIHTVYYFHVNGKLKEMHTIQKDKIL